MTGQSNFGFGFFISEELRVWAWGSKITKEQGLFIQASWPRIPVSGDKGVSFYLQIRGMYLSPEKCISCFQGDRKEAQSVPLALAI